MKMRIEELFLLSFLLQLVEIQAEINSPPLPLQPVLPSPIPQTPDLPAPVTPSPVLPDPLLPAPISPIDPRFPQPIKPSPPGNGSENCNLKCKPACLRSDLSCTLCKFRCKVMPPLAVYSCTQDCVVSKYSNVKSEADGLAYEEMAEYVDSCYKDCKKMKN